MRSLPLQLLLQHPHLLQNVQHPPHNVPHPAPCRTCNSAAGHIEQLIGTGSGMDTPEERLLLSRVNSSNAAELFLLRLPSAEERLDLRLAPLC